jgi:hypothetical protein
VIHDISSHTTDGVGRRRLLVARSETARE